MNRFDRSTLRELHHNRRKEERKRLKDKRKKQKGLSGKRKGIGAKESRVHDWPYYARQVTRVPRVQGDGECWDHD